MPSGRHIGTRGAERVHRTQSTVSQQIQKLEERVGRPLLARDRSGKQARPTADGELLTHDARRLLAIAQEAEDALARPAAAPTLRLGVPEDMDARRMSALLAGYQATRPGVRLDTVSGMSSDLQRQRAAGELDVALMKREPGSGDCIAAWREKLVWAVAASADRGLWARDAPVPLVLFPPGCIYRLRALRTLDQAGRPWRQAFGSHSLTGIQAAVAAGLGLSVLPAAALLPEHRVLPASARLQAPPPSELALVAGVLPPSLALRRLCDYLVAALEAPQAR